MATIISHTTPHHPRVTIVEAKDTIPSSSYSSSSLTSETLSQSSRQRSPLKSSSPLKDPLPPFTQSRVLKHVSLPRSKLREITPHLPPSLSLQQETQPPRVNPEPAQGTYMYYAVFLSNYYIHIYIYIVVIVHNYLYCISKHHSTD